MKKLFSILLFSLLSSCAGTLGGFKEWVFSASKSQLNSAIDSFYEKNPAYKISQGWKEFDDWRKRGYGFLDSRIFYFGTKPEEMYYVTYIGDNATQANPNQISIAIRAVCKGTPKWFLEKDLSLSEKHRIENRFEDEIISKIGIAYKSND